MTAARTQALHKQAQVAMLMALILLTTIPTKAQQRPPTWVAVKPNPVAFLFNRAFRADVEFSFGDTLQRYYRQHSISVAPSWFTGSYDGFPAEGTSRSSRSYAFFSGKRIKGLGLAAYYRLYQSVPEYGPIALFYQIGVDVRQTNLTYYTRTWKDTLNEFGQAVVARGLVFQRLPIMRLQTVGAVGGQYYVTIDEKARESHLLLEGSVGVGYAHTWMNRETPGAKDHYTNAFSYGYRGLAPVFSLMVGYRF